MKNIDWPRLIHEILDAMLISQKELSERCFVAQQTVSNWVTGLRNPNASARRTLLSLAKKANIGIYQFSNDTEPSIVAASEFREEYCGDSDFETMFTLFKALAPPVRKEIIEYTRFRLLQAKQNQAESLFLQDSDNEDE